MPRYRILRGKYVEGRHPAPEGSGEGARGIAKIYGKGAPDGDVVDTDRDLARFNVIGSPKFELLLENPPQHAPMTPQQVMAQAPAKGSTPAPAATTGKPDEKLNLQLAVELQKMTVKELETYAHEEEIDLKGANTKDAIIRTVLATTKNVGATK